MRICLLEKIKEQLQLVLIQLKIKTKETSTISENPNTSIRVNANKEKESCDSISSNDKLEAHFRSKYVKKGRKRKLPLKLQQK